MAKTKTILATIAILFFLSLVLRLSIVAQHGFDGLYGQDAYEYYDFAGELVNFVKTRNAPPPFFWSIGYPLHLAAGFAVLGESETLALAISVLLGALISPLVYLLGLQFGLHQTPAFFAGILIGISGQALQSSLVVMSDVPALFWALLSAVTFMQYLKSDKPMWLVITGFCVSIACLTRWIYLVLPALYLVMILITWTRWTRIIDVLLAIFASGIPLIPQLIYNRYNPTVVLEHSWVQNWSPANIFAKDFVNIDGTFHYETINGLFYAYPIYDIRYMSPILTILLIIGIIAIVRTKIWSRVLFALGWILLPYLFLAGIPYQNIRFPLISMPIIAVLALVGFQMVIEQIHNTTTDEKTDVPASKRIRLILSAGVYIWLIGGLIHTGLNGFNYANSFVIQHQQTKAIVEWIKEEVPKDSTLYAFDITATIIHYSDLNVIEFFYETPGTLNQRWFRGREDYLLLNVWQVENQWDGRGPQDNYHWFRDERGVEEIGRLHNFTLFKVEG